MNPNIFCLLTDLYLSMVLHNLMSIMNFKMVDTIVNSCVLKFRSLFTMQTMDVETLNLNL